MSAKTISVKEACAVLKMAEDWYRDEDMPDSVAQYAAIRRLLRSQARRIRELETERKETVRAIVEKMPPAFKKLKGTK